MRRGKARAGRDLRSARGAADGLPKGLADTRAFSGVPAGKGGKALFRHWKGLGPFAGD